MYRYKYLIPIIGFILFFSCITLHAQGDDKIVSKLPQLLNSNSQGTDFWFSYHPIWEIDAQIFRIYLASEYDTQVTLEIPGKGISRTLTTVKNKVMKFELTQTEAQCYEKYPDQPPLPDAVYPGYGIHVYSDDPIICYVVTVNTANKTVSEGLLAIPTATLGKEYRVATYPGRTDDWFIPYAPCYTSIIAPYDGTSVQFYMGGNPRSKTAGGLQYPNSAQKVLNKGDVWLIASSGVLSDLSGSKITSNKPVAVVSGNYYASIPYDLDNPIGDILIEMETPSYTWGTTYLVSNCAQRTKSSLIEIFSTHSNTKLYKDGRIIAYLNDPYGMEGDGFAVMRADVNANRPVVISGDNPITVTQFNTDKTDDASDTGDPFEMVLTSYEQFPTEIIFLTPFVNGDSPYDKNYLNIVYTSSDQNFIPDDLEFGEVINGEYSWKKVKDIDGKPGDPFAIPVNGKNYFSKALQMPSEGVYKVRAKEPFAAYSYGYSRLDSYGYPTYINLTDISVKDTVPPDPKWIVGCDGNIDDGFVKDYPNDDKERSNLYIISINKNLSFNYQFKYKTFIPGEDRTTTWTLNVIDPTQDAKAVITFTDRAGNDTTITIQYIATKLAIRPSFYDYGLLPLGETRDQTFWAINEDTVNVALLHKINLKAANQGFVISGINLPLVLQPKDSVSFNVKFTAFETRTYKFVDSIGIGDTCIFAYKARVEAAVGEPIIHVTSPGYMGEISIGKTLTKDCSIFNNGTVDLMIYGHTEPTRPEFTHNFPIISYNDPLIIKPNESYLFQVTFTPTSEGYVPPPGPNELDSMVFFNNATKTDSTAYFSGRGIQAALLAHSINWKPLRINRPLKDPRGPYPATSDYCDISYGGILLENTGTEIVRINSINASGDKGEFQFNEGMFINLVIPPKSDTIIPAFFLPDKTGKFSVTITYDNSVNSTSQTILTGTGILPKISTTDLDFDTTIVNDFANSQTRKVRFTNESYEWSDSLTITDFISQPNENAISPDWTIYGKNEGFKYDKSALLFPINLQPGQNVEFDAAFVAQKGGNAAGSLLSVSDAETDVTSNWKGYGLIEGITASGGSALVCINETQLIPCTINNTGTAPLKVTSLVISQNYPAYYFENPGDATGFTLMPDSSKNILIRYQPTIAGRDTANLIVNNSTLTSPEIFAVPQLTGTSVHYSRDIRIKIAGDKNPKIGDIVHATLYLDPGEDITMADLQEINCKITYTGRFLKPIESEIKVGSALQGKFNIDNLIIIESTNTITFNLKAIGSNILNETGSLVEFAFDTFLPTAENPADSSVITPLVNVVGTRCMEINNYTDSLKLQGTCVYDLRKILVNDFNYSMTLNPNPVGLQGCNLDYSLGLEGYTKIEIINMQGDIVLTPVSSVLKPGNYKLQIPVEKLASGMYVCRMSSGPYIESREMIIAK